MGRQAGRQARRFCTFYKWIILGATACTDLACETYLIKQISNDVKSTESVSLSEDQTFPLNPAGPQQRGWDCRKE
jgi:hypothetical protein